MSDMKRISSILAFLTIFSFFISSATINENVAESLARDFYLKKNKNYLRSNIEIKLVKCSVRENSAGYYIFNFGDKEGFVIVSSDDNNYPVLGYSLNGMFNPEDIPENMEYWLKSYEQQYIQTEKNVENTAIEPLLGTIAWNQTHPYNLLSPSVNSVKSVTGCVATAMAQIMKYYEWPVKGTGSHSYLWNNQTLFADFENTYYSWKDMLPSYGNMSTPKQDSAVAKLMYHCGVAVDMSFSPNGSSASYLKAANSLVNYFGYDTDIQLYRKFNHKYDEWINMILNELKASRPVIYTGSHDGSGHAFICDGYDGEGYFHLNWGWGGSSNGYFLLTSADPSYQGNSLSTGGYNEDQEIIIGIKKEDNIKEYIYNLCSYSNGLRSSISNISNIESEKVNFSISYVNYSRNTFTGNIGIGVYNNDSLIKIIAASGIVNINSYSGSSVNFNNVSLNGLPQGQLKIQMIYKPQLRTGWTKIFQSKNIPSSLNLNITGKQAVISNIDNTIQLALNSQINTTGNIYYNRSAIFNIPLKNKGIEFSSYVSILLTSVNNSNFQYLDKAVVLIKKDSSKVVTVKGVINLEPGEYKVKAVYDSNNMFVPTALVDVDKNSLPDFIINVLPEPAPANLELVKKISIIKPNEVEIGVSKEVIAEITNKGGLYDGNLTLFLFPLTWGNSLTSGGTANIRIENGETKTVKINCNLSYEAGSYNLALFYDLSGWRQFSPSGNSYIPIKLINKINSVSSEKIREISLIQNPVKDFISIKTNESILKADIYDINGILRKTVLNSENFSSEDLSDGVYILKILTNSKVASLRFIKKQ